MTHTRYNHCPPTLPHHHHRSRHHNQAYSYCSAKSCLLRLHRNPHYRKVRKMNQKQPLNNLFLQLKKGDVLVAWRSKKGTQSHNLYQLSFTAFSFCSAPPPPVPLLPPPSPEQVYPINPPTNDNNKSKNSHYGGMCKISEDNGRIAIQIEQSFVISEPPALRVMDLIGGLCSTRQSYERCFHNCKTPPSDHIPAGRRHPPAPN